MNWRGQSYDVGAGTHVPDPLDPARCLCGEGWEARPTEMEWQEHRFAPQAWSLATPRDIRQAR